MHSETHLCFEGSFGIGEALRASGIEGVGELAWGSHFCQFYRNADELLEIVAPYFAAGLAAGELCLWAVAPPVAVADATAALRRLSPKLRDRHEGGRIAIVPFEAIYVLEGRLDGSQALRKVEAELEDAYIRGFEGLRIAGNAPEFAADDWPHITTYATRLGALVASRRILSLCAYPLSCCGADEALEVIARHDFALMRRNGRWDVVENVAAHRARQALRDSEQYFRLIAQGAPDTALFTLDPQGRIASWNHGAQRICGWAAAEIVGRDGALLYPEDRRGSAALELEHAAAHGGYRGESECLRKDATLFPVETQISPLRDDRGQLRGFARTMRDVSERKRAEREAMANQAHLRALVESAVDGIATLDESGVILSLNSAALQMFGYEASEAIGRPLDLFVPQACDPGRLLAEWPPTKDAGAPGAGELMGRRKDGGAFPLELTIGEAPFDGGRLFIGFLRDLTERRRAEAQMRKLRVDRFDLMAQVAAGVAHEINQPLSAIAAYLGTARRLLQRGPAQDPARDLDRILERAIAQVMRSAQIIGQLRGVVAAAEPDKTLQSLHVIIEEARGYAALEPMAAKVAVTVELAAANDRVIVDRGQMRQVLINLERNAVEAMQGADKRELVISTRLVDGGMIRTDIADTGAGLSEEITSLLFEPFVTTKTYGLGVGLAVSRAIVEAHYGRLWAEANPGGGAILSFTLPLAGEHGDEVLAE
ncbi:PAS domain S-box protein [Methylosinus sp. Sm6]|uniref:PAS domain S-box protein n=1 Tax=Methylosinus sp. Sm6 TaxID=2866948 RepID=UPI001C991791|nr:PAS domain S-box protein [Methylosinus sp. Sm6]MBY6240906.1 PAS domain S-box protein [Methylosinus sp. Sm6]